MMPQNRQLEKISITSDCRLVEEEFPLWQHAPTDEPRNGRSSLTDKIGLCDECGVEDAIFVVCRPDCHEAA